MKLSSSVNLMLGGALACLVFGSVGFASDVITVRADGTGDFTDLPAAVAAAKDGDVLLVADGFYLATKVAKKSLTIVADAGQSPVIRGGMKVGPLARPKTVLLSGLELRGLEPSATTSMHAVIVNRSKGAVRIDGCVLQGWDRPTGGYYFCGGGSALSVGRSDDVAVTRTTATGGRSGLKDSSCASYSSPGGKGLLSKGSAVATWRSLFTGGPGGPGVLFLIEPGDGGAGAKLENSRLYTFHNSFQGGGGGDDFDVSWVTCGVGGPGILGVTMVQVYDKDSAFQGGAGGVDTHTGTQCSDGAALDLPPGQPIDVPGWPYALEGPRVVREGQAIALDAFGLPGDSAYVAVSTRTRFRFEPALEGGWYVRHPLTSPIIPLGVMGGGGKVSRVLRAPELAPGQDAEVLYLQVLVRDVSGAKRLGSPLSIVVLDETF